MRASGIAAPPTGEASREASRPPAARAPGTPWLRAMWNVPLGAHAIPALDGVRAVAASLVFLVHYQAAFGRLLGDEPARPYRAGEYLAAVGYHGVSVFFVLSGFLIYGSLLARPVPLGRYLGRRVRRIYPPFFAVLVLYLVLSALFPERSKLPDAGAGLVRYVAANVLLLPGVFPIEPIVTVSWSLSFELAFYVAIALVVLGLRLRAWPRRRRVLLWCAAVGAWALAGNDVRGVVSSFILFVPGILVAESANLPRVRAAAARVPAWAVAVLFALALLAQPLLGGEFVSARITSAVFAPQVLSTFLLAGVTALLVLHAITVGTGGSALARPALRKLGVVSYSFYLIHGLVINAVAALCWWVGGEQVLRPVGPLAYVLLLPPVFLAAVGAALLLFRAVEEPLSLS